MRYYGALGIDKSDVDARSRATGRNFDFFGAPVGMIFTIDACLKKHSWLDYGLFLQTVMIAARSRGLHTCPQVSFARYQSVIANQLALEPGHEVVFRGGDVDLLQECVIGAHATILLCGPPAVHPSASSRPGLPLQEQTDVFGDN